MPGGLGEFASGGIALDGKIAAADAAEAKYLVLRIPPRPPVRQVLTMDILSRSKGPAGGFRLQAQDRAGLLTLDMRINPATSTYNAHLGYQFNDQVLPKDAVPVLALCNALAAGEQMAIATLDGQILALGSGPFNHLNWPDGDGYLRCARQLADIQERAGAFFPLPLAFEPEDQCWMDYADKLLRGEDGTGGFGHGERLKRTVSKQPGVTFDIAGIVAVVVDAVGIVGQCREAEQQCRRDLDNPLVAAGGHCRETRKLAEMTWGKRLLNYPALARVDVPERDLLTTGAVQVAAALTGFARQRPYNYGSPRR